MTISAAAHHGYASATIPIRSEKSIEYEIIARVTRRLKLAADAGPDGFPALASALHDNKRLWNAFAVDVAHPENGLPDLLRARLFYLAEFTHEHSRAVLARKADAKALIEVNLAVLRGLRGGVD
ncbi:MAG: flagellar biosynthesis regulator FlaF [Marinibacterium sp.]